LSPLLFFYYLGLLLTLSVRGCLADSFLVNLSLKEKFAYKVIYKIINLLAPGQLLPGQLPPIFHKKLIKKWVVIIQMAIVLSPINKSIEVY